MGETAAESCVGWIAGRDGEAEDGVKEEPFSKMPQETSPIPGRARPLAIAPAASHPG